MREEVIVHVKTEVPSEDEEEIDPSSIPQSSSNGITAEVSANTKELNLESSSSSDSHQHDWPCAVCGRLFQQREEVLEHTKSEHAEQMLQEMILDESLRAKMAIFQQQQRLLALLNSGPAAASALLQQPAAAVAMLQLLGMGAVPAKNEVPLLPSFPVPPRKQMRMEKAGSPYESRRAFPGRPRHPVWSLFLRIDKFDAECTLCKSRVRSACPTNLCRHLNNNHCELASQLFVKWKKQKEDLGGSFPPLEPRANRHKSSSTSSTSSSTSCSSLPAPSSAPVAAPLVASLPGFPHLPLVLQQQQLLLKQREQSTALAPEVLKAIDAQLIVNSKIIAQAQKTLEGATQSVPTPVPPSGEEGCEAGPSRVGVIQFGGVEQRDSDETAEQNDDPAIDILSISPDLDLFVPSSSSSRRASSAPPPLSRSTVGKRRSDSAPPMIALMDGSTGAFDMYSYQDASQSQSSSLLLQEGQREAAAALRGQPSQQTLENWFTTAYAQPVQAAAVMNAGAYGTMAPPTDAASLAATVAESGSFPSEIKNVPLFSEEQQRLFAASSSDPSQLQLFQTVKQELLLDDMEDSNASRPSVFQTAPSSSSLMSLLPGQPPAKRGRPTENPCWEYFDRLDDTLVKCRTCEKVVKSACATNMTKHLERHHPDEYQVLLQKIRYSRQFKPNSIPVSSSSASVTTPSQQFSSSAMALNHIAHQPQHHLLQPMASDLGQPLAHHLPLSPDPSPAAPHCFLSTQHHLLKDPSSLRPEMLLIPTSDGLIPNVDPNSYHIPSDFYQTMQFDNSPLFDNASQWQQRHFAPVASSGYEQWMGADQSSSAFPLPDEWSQSAAVQQQAMDQLQLQQNSVIQSVVTGAPSSGEAVLDAATLAAAAASDASSTSSTSSSSCGGNPATTSLVGLMRSHESKPYMKRNRKTEHPVWEFFKRTADGNAQCSICSGIVKSPCSSNFMRHLMRHHSTEYNAVYAKWSQKRGPTTIKSTSASF